MSLLKKSLFYSKILLFGEYGIIQDSMGLSIPFDNYQGSLIFESENTDFAQESNASLKKYLTYLRQLEEDQELPCELDLSAFERDIEQGVLFDSSIPQGYGVGSSGALVASIYSKYAINGIVHSDELSNENILKLKQIFAKLENFFHGTSSGLDPLICYLNLPILIKSKNELESVGIPKQGNGKGAIFLLDTGQTGETQPLVSHFLEKCKEEGFRNMLKREFKKYNDQSITAFLNKDIKPLFQNVKHLSMILIEHFKPMIPQLFQKHWKEGIESNAYYLKLCGSGGGGFILGFTEDIEVAKHKLQDYNINVIYQF